MKIAVVFFFLIISANVQAQCSITVSTINDSGPGSLRQAILDANLCTGAPTITFSISTSSTIVLLSDLPSITVNNLLINGTTSPGFSYPYSMVTIWWQGLDDCLQNNSGNNNSVRGLAFTDNFLGNGDAAIRLNGGNNFLVDRCRAYNQRKNLVRVQGGNNARVIQCTAENFNNDGSARVLEVNSGSLIEVANSSFKNIPRNVYEMNNSASGGLLGKVSIHGNTITHVGYEDGSPGTKGSHIVASYTNHTAIFSIRNNNVDTSSSKFIEFINTNGSISNNDSIYNNSVLNVRGQQTIYVESNSGSYGGIVIHNNTFTGTGIGLDNVDQVIEIGGWSNNYTNAVISNNTITNYHGRAIMCRFSDNMVISGNVVYACSNNACIELNDDCDNVVLKGNYLGTDMLNSTGLALFTGNTIDLNDCDNCTVGGDFTLGSGNVIVASSSGGGKKAINISTLCQGTTLIRGNYINVSSDGYTCLSSSTNTAVFVEGPSVTTIGGDSLTSRNFICGGANGRGIEFKSSNGIIQGNLIGCTANGCDIANSNLQYGIQLNGSANNTIIGSTTNLDHINKIGYCQEAIRNDDLDNILWSCNEYWRNTAAFPVNNNGGSPNANIVAPTITSVTLPNIVQGTGSGGRIEIYLWDSDYPEQGFKYLGFTTGSTWLFTSPTAITHDIVALEISGSNTSEFASFDVIGQGSLGTLSCSITTSINSEASNYDHEKIKIYPNPSAGVFHIEGAEPNNTLMLTDISGKIILTITNFPGKGTIDLNTLDKGIYLIQIISSKGSIVRKVIID